MGWLEGFILRNINPVTLQEPDVSPEDALEILKMNVQAGVVDLVANQQKRILFIARRHNKYIADIHVMSENGNGFELVAEGRKALEWLWVNTPYKRAELRTSNKGVIAMAKRCGWECVGTHKNAFFTQDGERIDDYIYGIDKPE